jgi:hypothetical protein
MTDTPTLTFHRLSKPDEDGLIFIRVRAKNEIVAATGEGYTSAKSLLKFAEELSVFPSHLPASSAFSARCGSCVVVIELETLDGSGHVGIKVSIHEGTTPQLNTATLWLTTYPHALMSLSQQLQKIADLSVDHADLPT